MSDADTTDFRGAEAVKDSQPAYERVAWAADEDDEDVPLPSLCIPGSSVAISAREQLCNDRRLVEPEGQPGGGAERRGACWPCSRC